jgi:signal transduction histidine kinase
MLRFTLYSFGILILMWVIAPLILMSSTDIPIVTVRAASGDSLGWLFFALLVTGGILTYTGWRPRNHTRRRWVLILGSLFFVWVLYPTVWLSSEIVRQPPIAIQAVSALALAWMTLALLGTTLLAIKFGKQIHTQYDIRHQRQTLLTIVNDQLDEGIALFNRRLGLQWVNTSGRSYLFEHEMLREDVQRLLQRAAETKRVASQSLILNEETRVNVQASPLPDGSVYAIARPLQSDIDQINFYERFIRRIVHDMRNPLAAIVAHASNLQTAPVSDSEIVVWQNTAVTIEKEAQRLTRLVDSMLFDARLSYVPLALENIDLIDVIENVFYQFDERATRENKSIEVETPPPPAPLEADHDLLVRALSNLVDNSLKYSSAGAKVRIALEVTDTTYTLKVIDTGDGIPPELLPDRIFEALVRGRAKDSGSGLGLSIVRKIAELHGGSISAHSVIGKGTTMMLCLPR